MSADTWPPAWWSDRSRELRAQLEQRSKQLEEIHPVNTRQGGVFDPAYARLAAELSASVSADFKVKERVMTRVSDAEVEATIAALGGQWLGPAYRSAVVEVLEAAAKVREEAGPPTCRVCDGVGRLAVGQRLADGTYETRECHNCHGTAVAERAIEAEPMVPEGFVCINGQTVDVGTLSSFLFQCLWKVSALGTCGEHASAAVGVAAWLEQSHPTENPITERMRASAAEVRELADAYYAAEQESAEPMVPLSAVANLRDSLQDDREFHDERSKHESVEPAERLWSTGAAAAYNATVAYLDAAFPQLKEAS